jgi:hypothetical protein
MNAWGNLLGMRIAKVYISEGEQEIAFVPHYGEPLLIGTDADCCSETWFADIVGLSNLIIDKHVYSNEVRGVEILDLPEPEDGRTRQEEDKAYGLKITTCKGLCDIVYRNSSNGYYGGDVYLIDNKKFEDFTWREITEDWSA